MSEDYPTGPEIKKPRSTQLLEVLQAQGSEVKLYHPTMTEDSIHHTQNSLSQIDDGSYYRKRRGPLYRLRYQYREYMAEFVGTFTYLLIAVGLIAHITFRQPSSDVHFLAWLMIGLSVMCGIYASEGISGAHINPAVTFALAFNKRFPWHKVLGYMASQVAAAIVASALVLVLYIPDFQTKDAFWTIKGKNATAGVFYISPMSGYSSWNTLYGEIVATMLMMIVVFATGVNENNRKPVSGVAAISVGLAIACIGSATGQYAMNPIRDLGPRIFASMVYGPRVYFTNFWVASVGPLIGGALGGAVHDFFCIY